MAAHLPYQQAELGQSIPKSKESCNIAKKANKICSSLIQISAHGINLTELWRCRCVGESSPPFASHHACTVRNDVCTKTVMASRTHASPEPLSDMLGVVWTESCAIFYIEWCRKYEGYNACVDGVTHFLTHHLCLPQKSTNKTQRYGWTLIYGNDRNRILCNAVSDGICQWILVSNLLRII